MKKLLLISCLFLGSAQFVNAQDDKDKTSTTTDGKTTTNDGKTTTNDGKTTTTDGKTTTTDGKTNTSGSSSTNANQAKDLKAKLDNLFNSALNDFKAKQFDKSLATIAEAETIIKNNNINTEKRFADLKETVLKSKNSTSTAGNNKTNTTSNTGNSELKAKLDNLFQSALMDYKAGQYDKSLASISNAEQLLKNNNMTDVRFSDLKNSVNQARSKQSNSTDGKTNTTDGKTNTTDGKSNTNDGKTNTTDGKTTTNDGKTNTSGSSTNANQAKDLKAKLDNLFNTALNDFKAKQFDKSLATIAEAETIIKNNNINTEKRFADLKETVLKSKNSTSTAGNNKTNTTSNTGNSELKAKLDNLFQSALMDYKAGQYDKSLASISNAEQLLKNNNMTDVRFSDLKNSVNQARSKQSNSTDGKTNTTDGKSNTTTGNTSTNNDVKAKLENYYKDAVAAVNMGKYDVATSIINDAEALMKSTNTMDNRFDNLKKEIALKTKK